MNAIELDRLAEAREQFLAFVRRRVSDPELAEDIVQASLLKAAQGIEGLRDSERVMPWFYAILHNTVTDAYRRHAGTAEVPLPDGFDIEDEANVVQQACECFRALLPVLKPEYAEVIELLDLRDQPSEAVAQRLGVMANNLKVRHHRARQALRRRLEEVCRVCAVHHCLDCTCEAAPTAD